MTTRRPSRGWVAQCWRNSSLTRRVLTWWSVSQAHNVPGVSFLREFADFRGKKVKSRFRETQFVQRKKTCRYIPKNLSKSLFGGAPDGAKLISRLKTFPGEQPPDPPPPRNRVPLMFREKHVGPITPLMFTVGHPPNVMLRGEVARLVELQTQDPKTQGLNPVRSTTTKIVRVFLSQTCTVGVPNPPCVYARIIRMIMYARYRSRSPCQSLVVYGDMKRPSMHL